MLDPQPVAAKGASTGAPGSPNHGRRAGRQCMREIEIHERELERKMGFEPTTLSLARRCSTTEPLPLVAHGCFQQPFM